MSSAQPVPQHHPKKQVQFCSDTKVYDGLSPLSLLVEEPLVHVFDGRIRNKQQFVNFFCGRILHHKLDAEAALQHVCSSIDNMIQRLSMCKQVKSTKGSPMLICGGGKGYYLPPSAIALLKKLRLWVAEIDVHAQFAVEISI